MVTRICASALYLNEDEGVGRVCHPFAPAACLRPPLSFDVIPCTSSCECLLCGNLTVCKQSLCSGRNYAQMVGCR